MSLRKRVMSLVLMGSITAVTFIPGSVKNNSSIVLAAGEYNVNTTINRYVTASDAAEGVESVGTYAPGKYYIYKQANGMLNISTSEGGPGSWINPNENDSPVEEVPETTKPTVTEEVEEKEVENVEDIVNDENSYELTFVAKKYSTADNAINNSDSVGTYAPGTYYIYKKAYGMINITKNKGVPGGWINPGVSTPEAPVVTKPTTTTPSTSKPEITKPTPTTTTASSTVKPTIPAVGEEIVFTSSLTKYMNASDAASKINSNGTYPAGKYYIYKTANGMVNVTNTPGVPGAWINPGTVVIAPPATESAPPVTKPATTTPATTSPKTTTPTTTAASTAAQVPVVGGTFVVNSSVAKYRTADEAANRVGSTGTYGAGTYYIYKIYNGMINISKTPNVPGGWINYDSSTGTVGAPGSTQPYTGTSITDFAKQFEGDNGYKFYTWYGLKQRDEWCAMFVSYVAAHTGNSSLIPKYSYVDDYTDYYKKFNNITVGKDFVPTKDMLILFDWQPNGWSDHIGIVDYSDGKKVYTIEGNSSDRVRKQEYDINSKNILGYLLPGYPGAKVNGKDVPGGAFIKRLTR